MTDFKNSETAVNLMRAFAGESMARNRYIFAASQAKKQNLHIIEAAFLFTANQEKEHAEIFYNHLKSLAGETIDIQAGYPIDHSQSVLELLKSARHNEYEEHSPIYPAFGDKAKAEGFPAIASSFYQIAAIEKTHGDRFGMLADLLASNSLFKESSTTKWLCLNCGHVHEGPNAPATCPVCFHDQGYFIRLSMAPYTKC